MRLIKLNEEYSHGASDYWYDKKELRKVFQSFRGKSIWEKFGQYDQDYNGTESGYNVELVSEPVYYNGEEYIIVVESYLNGLTGDTDWKWPQAYIRESYVRIRPKHEGGHDILKAINKSIHGEISANGKGFSKRDRRMYDELHISLYEKLLTSQDIKKITKAIEEIID